MSNIFPQVVDMYICGVCAQYVSTMVLWQVQLSWDNKYVANRGGNRVYVEEYRFCLIYGSEASR